MNSIYSKAALLIAVLLCIGLPLSGCSQGNDKVPVMVNGDVTVLVLPEDCGKAGVMEMGL